MTWPFDPLRMFDYDVIVADPPWDFVNYSDKGTEKGADPHYQVMATERISAMPVGELARRDCLLLLWTTGWAMATGQARGVASAWGFTPTTELVWRKLTVNGKPRMGTGYRARTLHEPILLAVTGSPVHAPFRSLFDGIAREHSRKPDEFYDMVLGYTPAAHRRCDLFARERRDGFDCWGNEVGKFT